MHGWCSECGKYRLGRIVGTVEQNSGPGRTITICEPCEATLKKRLAALDRIDRRR